METMPPILTLRGRTMHAAARLATSNRPPASRLGHTANDRSCRASARTREGCGNPSNADQILGLEPLARIVASSVVGLEPEYMGMGPVLATRRVLDQAGMSLDDIDLVEINEAFAAQVLASVDELALDMDKLNVHGGAIALGHPFGMTGARIMGTLINGLRSRDATLGLETMCVGGGQGMAMIVERLS